MKNINLGRDRRAWSPETGAGTGGGTPPDPNAPDAAAAAAAAAAASAAAGASKPADWVADARFSDDHRSFLTTKGMAVFSDPLDAVAKLVGIGQAADKRFGKPIDAVLDRPAEGQSIAEWRRANAAAFGLPEAPEGYEIKRPETLADGIAWNSDLEAKMRGLAHERGLPQEDVQAMVGMYADYVQGMTAQIDTDLAKAEAKLDGELTGIWGAETEANKTRARQAAVALAERAGLDTDGIEAVAGLLASGKPGETLALKMFKALGDMMAEHPGVGLRAGAQNLGMTAQEAQAQFAAFNKPDGDWAKAVITGNAAEIARLKPEWERLSKLAAGAKA